MTTREHVEVRSRVKAWTNQETLMRENIVSKPCSKGMQDDNVS